MNQPCAPISTPQDSTGPAPAHSDKERLAPQASFPSPEPAPQPPIFVGGAGRSGTTLLRVILDSHPHIACGPELKVIPILSQKWLAFQQPFFAKAFQGNFVTKEDLNQVFRQTIASLLEKYRLHHNKPRSAEKSPNNVFLFPHLHILFPQSPLIHVIRDGRDVIASLLSMNWIDQHGEPLEYTRCPGAAASYWADAVRAGRQLKQLPGHEHFYLEVRYEDLVQKPLATLKKLFAFLSEPWDARVLDFYKQERSLASESSAKQVQQPLYASAVGRWKQDLHPSTKPIIKQFAGDLLVELGYTQDQRW